MTRNGSTTPFPNELTTPPPWSSHTSRGSSGSKRPRSLTALTVTGCALGGSRHDEERGDEERGARPPAVQIGLGQAAVERTHAAGEQDAADGDAGHQVRQAD